MSSTRSGFGAAAAKAGRPSEAAMTTARKEERFMGIGMRVGDSGTSFVLGELPRQAFPLHAAGTSAAMANRMPHVHRFPAAWCVAQALQNSATGRAPLLAAPHRQA